MVSERALEIHHSVDLGWNYLLEGLETTFTLEYWEIATLSAFDDVVSMLA